MREPKRSRATGNSCMSARLSRTARCRSTGADDEQETATARAGQLGARRPGLERPLDRRIYLGIGDARRQLPLGLPALAHRFADRVYIPAAQSVGGQAREVVQEVELIAGGFDVGGLLGEDRVRAPGDSRVEQHDVPLQVPSPGRRELQLFGQYLITGPEADVADAAVGGNVLILLANRLPAAVDLDRAGTVGQFLRRYLAPAVREKGMQQANRHRGGGAEARAARRRDVGQRGDLHAVRHAGHPHSLPDQLMFQLLDPGDDLLLGVVDVDVVVEPLLDDHVDVLVDRAVQDPAAMFAVVIGQVRAPAEETDTQRRLGDDHVAARTGHSSWTCWYASAVPTSRK